MNEEKYTYLHNQQSLKLLLKSRLITIAFFGAPSANCVFLKLIKIIQILKRTFQNCFSINIYFHMNFWFFQLFHF